MTEIKQGSYVTWKPGRNSLNFNEPTMWVRLVRGAEFADCCWFDRNQVFRTEQFPLFELHWMDRDELLLGGGAS